MVGKTGTTTDEGDAWFVGWTPQFTTAVWVGFPNKLVPMPTQFNGGRSTGGTFPAEIWRAFMESALQINAEEHPPKPGTSTDTATTGADTNPTYTYAPSTATRAGGDATTERPADDAADDPDPDRRRRPRPRTGSRPHRRRRPPTPTPTTPAPTTPRAPTPAEPGPASARRAAAPAAG